ncbi:MAG: hypothetical protein IKG25_06545, partial [Mogibacterium sp.]|nr:hypothetical protein [Mogibacterium sp.]
QDVIPDLAVIRNGAAKGATAYQKPESGVPYADMDAGVQHSLDGLADAQSAASAAEDHAEAAAGSAEQVAEDVAELKQAIQDLPDGQAVSATVAEHTTQIAGLQGDISDIEDGSKVAGLANDIASWKNTNSKVVDTQTAPVFTAGGNESVNSNENARIISLSPGTLTAGAASLVSNGFNLLRNATQIGSGQVWYFLVPYLKFGTFGTADENNGVLFTDSNEEKLTPTVYWKALYEGVPTSATDGVAAGYTDSNGYRFYTTPAGHEGEVGYFIVQATRATTCAHVAWSGRYDEYIAVDNAGDAGASLALTSILNNLHSNGLMYNIGLVADSVNFTATTAYWTKNCDRKQGSDLTWTNTLQEDNETYLHTTTIADMLDDSAVVCTNDNINLVVSGKEVSYTDTNEAAITTDYIYYQLATAVTGTVAGTYSFVIEDWGVIYFTGVSGTVVSIIEYSQNIVDTLRKLATTGFNDAMRVIAESLNQLAAENVRLKTYAERLEARIEALES